MKKPSLNELTLREKIGQTAMGRPGNRDYENPEKYPYGHIWALGNVDMGVINMADRSGETKSGMNVWLDYMENYSKKLKVPILQAMDCTAGIQRSFYEAEPFLDPVTIGAAGDDDLAYEAGTLKARLLKSVGSKWLWCPEVDLPSRRSAVNLGRLYTDDIERMIRMGSTEIRGTQSVGVAACAKHFPSDDGMEYRDSHVAQTCCYLTMDQWWQRQGRVFQAMIDAGVYSIMISHTAFPACDPRKINGKYVTSTASYRVITELLKEKMGFGGVVISDAVGMRSLINSHGGDMNRVYVECIKAGNDVLLGVYDGYFEAIENAVKSGEIPESRIDDACQRVLDLKEKLGLFEDGCTYASGEIEQVNADVREFKARVAKKAVSLVCNKEQLLPVKRENIKNVAIVYSGHDREGDDKAWDAIPLLAKAFEKRGAKVHIQRRLTSFEEVKKLSDENDLIIHAGYLMRNIPEGFSSFYGEEMTTFYYALDSGAEKTVGLGLGSPFMYFDFFSSYRTFINAYNYSPETMEAVTAAIYGEIPFAGCHPFRLIPPEMEKAMNAIGIEP